MWAQLDLFSCIWGRHWGPETPLGRYLELLILGKPMNPFAAKGPPCPFLHSLGALWATLNDTYGRIRLCGSLSQICETLAAWQNLRKREMSKVQGGPAPPLPFKIPQIPSNRDYKALNRATLGGPGDEEAQKFSGLPSVVTFPVIAQS